MALTRLLAAAAAAGLAAAQTSYVPATSRLLLAGVCRRRGIRLTMEVGPVAEVDAHAARRELLRRRRRRRRARGRQARVAGLAFLARPLQSVVYLIGLVFCCGGLTYVVVQKNSGKSVWSAVPTLDPATLDPKSSVQMKKLAVTPDTTYSGSA